MATPGEPACREVAPCGAGTWGSIPVEPDTQHVDVTYLGGDGDGTPDRPWPTIQQAVDAAADDAIVAIAAGSYHEDVLVLARPVRLWGRCPSMVEVAGSLAGPAGVAFIGTATSGSEVRDLSVRGELEGIVVAGAEQVEIGRVWLHDLEGHGMNLVTEGSEGGVRITGSLVERASEVGVFIAGAEVVIEETVIRGTRGGTNLQAGAGAFVRSSVEPPRRGNASFVSSVIEDNRSAGLVVFGSDAKVDRSVVRDTRPQASDDADGEGIIASAEPDGDRAAITVERSVLERNLEAAMALEGSDGTLDSVTIRDTQPQVSDGTGGVGLLAGSKADQGSLVTVRHSTIEDSIGMGVFVASSDVTVERSLVRRTTQRALDQLYGDGVLVIAYGGVAAARLGETRVEHSDRAAVAVFGSSVALAGTVLECNVISIDGEALDTVPFALDDLGGNVCECGAVVDPCKVTTANLSPPPSP